MRAKIDGYLKNISREIIYNTEGIWNESLKTLLWKENDKLETTIKIDFEKKEITRNNKEFKMILTFDKKKDKIMNCKLLRGGTWYSFSLTVRILKEEIKNKVFKLKYETYLDDEKLDTITLDIHFTTL